MKTEELVDTLNDIIDPNGFIKASDLSVDLARYLRIAIGGFSKVKKELRNCISSEFEGLETAVTIIEEAEELFEEEVKL
jgi:hypothetical protein